MGISGKIELFDSSARVSSEGVTSALDVVLEKGLPIVIDLESGSFADVVSLRNLDQVLKILSMNERNICRVGLSSEFIDFSFVKRFLDVLSCNKTLKNVTFRSHALNDNEIIEFFYEASKIERELGICVFTHSEEVSHRVEELNRTSEKMTLVADVNRIGWTSFLRTNEGDSARGL